MAKADEEGGAQGEVETVTWSLRRQTTKTQERGKQQSEISSGRRKRNPKVLGEHFDSYWRISHKDLFTKEFILGL